MIIDRCGHVMCGKQEAYMGLINVVKKIGNISAEIIGSEFPNALCTEEFKCHDCSLIWYLPKSITTNAKTIIAQPGHECTKRDGKHHWMWRVNQ